MIELVEYKGAKNRQLHVVSVSNRPETHILAIPVIFGFENGRVRVLWYSADCRGVVTSVREDGTQKPSDGRVIFDSWTPIHRVSDAALSYVDLARPTKKQFAKAMKRLETTTTPIHV